MRDFFKYSGMIVLLSAAASLHAGPLGYTYTYTGSTFTTVMGPYTTSDFVSISLTLSAPLAGTQGMTDESAAVESFEITDGVLDLTSANADSATIQFATSGGNITEWYISVGNFSGGLHSITSCGFTDTQCIPSSWDGGSVTGGFGLDTNSPGEWVQPAAVPEPGTLLSTATAALLIAWQSRRAWARRRP